MKTTIFGKKAMVAAVVSMVLAFGFVLSACTTGDYEYEEDGVKAILTLKSGKKFDMVTTMGGESQTLSGTWKKDGKTITLTGDNGGIIVGTIDGKKITFIGMGTFTKKSIDGLVEAELEFADDFEGFDE
ncbi:MAG: hypothetical protein Ta2B_10260 [Termitinemataceae bacterium]|nr:MAG: hypothetical protein Ta2B_10260 [Termitinemataceae bacterium]